MKKFFLKKIKIMKNIVLDVKEIENSFVVTINKKELNAEYILGFLNWLQFVAYKQDGKNNFSTEKKNEKLKKQRIWNYSGSVILNKHFIILI